MRIIFDWDKAGETPVPTIVTEVNGKEVGRGHKFFHPVAGFDSVQLAVSAKTWYRKFAVLDGA